RNLDDGGPTPTAITALETTFAIRAVQSAGNSPHAGFQFRCEGPFGLDQFLAVNWDQHCLSDLYGRGRIRNIAFFWLIALAKCQNDEQERAAEHRVGPHFCLSRMRLARSYHGGAQGPRITELGSGSF